MSFQDKKQKNFNKDSKKAEKNSQKEHSKNSKALQEIEEEKQVQQQINPSKKSLNKQQKLKHKEVDDHQEDDIQIQVEEEVEQNETSKKLSKKEKKELKKQLKLKEQQNQEVEEELEEVEAKPEKETKSQKQHQTASKSEKIKNEEGDQDKKSKKKEKKKEQQEEKQEEIKKIEPRIIKKPKITIIEEDDESEGEVEKSKSEDINSDLEGEEEDSDLEELRRVKKQMKNDDSDDDEIPMKKNFNKFGDDSDEENFKDISSDEEENMKKKKKLPAKAEKTKSSDNKAQTKKSQGGKGKIVNLNEKVKLKHLAICIPDSIISIPQSSELRSYFISELARTAAIFCVDEIIILKDHSYIQKSQNFHQGPYIARNLQYLETPQYLRKQLFPIHPDLKNAGLMNPIECHHHLKSDQYCPYREGVVMNRPTKENDGSWVEIGLKKQAKIPYKLATNTRVTLRVNEPTLEIEEKNYSAEIVSSKEPKEKLGLYWGYQVRLAENLSQVLKGENEIKYDIKLLINQGDHQQFSEESINETEIDFVDQNVLIVFSGYNNLESIIDSDEQTRLSGKDALNKFDANFTMQKGQVGVKQLRLEEEMSFALSILRRKFN